MMFEIIKYMKARYLNEKAQGITEYALLLVFVVAVAVAVLFGTDAGNGLKNGLTNAFGSVTNELNKNHAF